MKFYKSEKDMPIGEIEKSDELFHHLVCEGSRRHVLHWDSNGEHCKEPRCEINSRNKQIK